MWNETIETRGHTAKDGTLNLTVKVDAADADVEVTVQVRPVTSSERVDANGWPIDFFERVAGSMPDLQRAPQGEFENRLALE
jgi:hypothetical protein